MHEVEIATSIAELAREEAGKRAVQVLAIHLKLGALSGVVREALESSYELVTAGTSIQGTALVIQETPVVIYCPSCREPREIASVQNYVCPVCGGPPGEVLQGDELQVTGLEIASQ